MATVVVSKIKSTGGDYTNLNNWYKAKKGDLVARDTIEIAELYSDTDAGFCKWTTGDCNTDSDHYFQVRAADPSGISANRGWGFYKTGWDQNRLPPRCTMSSGRPVLDVGVPFTKIGPGISIYNSVNTGSGTCGIALRDGPAGVNGCVIDSVAIYSWYAGVIVANWASGSSAGHLIKNSFVTGYGFYANQVFCTNSSLLTAFSNYIISGNWAIGLNCSKNAKIYSENNYIGTPNGACYNTATGGQIRKGLKDATATTEALDATLRSITKASVLLADISDPVYGCYRAIGSGCPLRAKGVDLRSHSIVDWKVTHDFEGDIRPAVPDIGWDQYTPARQIISAIKPSGGGDFQTLAGWSNARQAYMHVKNVCEIAEIYGGATSGTSPTGGTNKWGTMYHDSRNVGVDCQIKIRAAAGFEQDTIALKPHKAYIMNPGTTLAQRQVAAFNIPVGNTIIGPGIYFDYPVQAFQMGVSYTGDWDSIIYRCIIKPAIVEGYGAIQLTQAMANLYIRNCYIETIPTQTWSAIYLNQGRGKGALGSLIDIANCTIIQRGATPQALSMNGSAGTGGDIVPRNCYVYAALSEGSKNNGYQIQDVNSATSDNRATSFRFRNIAFDNYNFVDAVSAIPNPRPRPESVLAQYGGPINYRYKCDNKDLFGNVYGAQVPMGCLKPLVPTIVEKDVDPTGGGDYTTIAAWEAARRGNLVASGSCFLEQANCFKGGDLGTLSIASGVWVTGPENYIKIVAASGHAQSGVWDTTNKAYATIATDNFLWMISAGYTYVRGIQLGSSSAGSIPLTIHEVHGQKPVDLDRIFIRHNGSNGARPLALYNNWDITMGHILRTSILINGPTYQGFCIYCGTTRKNLIRVYFSNLIELCGGNACPLLAYSSLTAGNNSNIIEDGNYLYGASVDFPTTNIYRTATGGTITKGVSSAANQAETTTVALGAILYDTTTFNAVINGSENFHIPSTSKLIKKAVPRGICLVDIDGNLRPADKLWTIGPLEGQASSSFWQNIHTW